MKVISGGQTGVDRAALDAAIENGLEHGGWCPLGRIAEDGVIPDRYSLKQTPSADYPQRTLWNVRDSDATLALTMGRPTGGTAYTIECAKNLLRPHLVVDVGREVNNKMIVDWLRRNNVTFLNVAGPRESTCPGIYWEALKILSTIFRTTIQ